MQESAGGSSGGADFGKLCGPATDLTYKNNGSIGRATGLAASETQGVFIPNDHLLSANMTAEGTSGYTASEVAVTDM